MNRRSKWAVLGIGLLAAAGLILAQCRPQPVATPAAAIEGLAQPAGTFSRADGERKLTFPKDHGAHDDFQTEWWYYTGNLTTREGRHFGFQLTFFRRAVAAADATVTRTSGWGGSQVYLAHFALTDTQGKKFNYFDRVERGAAGLAGAQGEPGLRVWLWDWQVQQTGDNTYRLNAETDEAAVTLNLMDTTGPVLQGRNGYSQKGSDPGNASYYYSQPRLEAEGEVRIGQERFAVSGTSWMDHEFSTSALAPDQVGWDWFAVQLSDGSELMMFQLRKTDGSVDGYSSGTIIRPDGSTRSLVREDFTIRPEGSWHSPHSGGVYPSGWTVEVPSEELTLTIKPRLADQELNLWFIYWEGAVQIEGTRGGAVLTGSGYVELTGYARSMQGQF